MWCAQWPDHCDYLCPVKELSKKLSELGVLDYSTFAAIEISWADLFIITISCISWGTSGLLESLENDSHSARRFRWH